MDPVASLGMAPQSDSAFAFPSSLSFEQDEDSLHLETGYIALISTNAPTPYTATILGEPVFTELLNDSGMTDDSVCFTVDGGTLTPGTYRDTLLFNVEGVDNNPVVAILTLTVYSSGSGPDSAYIVPDTLYFAAEDDTAWFGLLIDYAYLFSTNAPTPYFGWVQYSEPMFTILGDSAGTTNDSIAVLVDPEGIPQGVYYNTVVFFVEGVSDSLVFLTVCLNVGDTVVVTDSAWVAYDSMYFETDVGSAIVDTGYFNLYSTNAPAAYSAFVLDEPAFTSLFKDSGLTNDTIGFQVGADILPPGLYRDTVVFNVGGVDNSPVVSIVYLNVKDTTSPPDSAWLTPNTLNFTAEFGTEIPLTGYAVLLSTIDPAPYSAEVVDTGTVFTQLEHDTGMTPHSVSVIVDPSLMSPGVHYNWVRCSVEGVDDVYLTVVLVVDTVPVDTAALYPSSLSFVAQAYTEELQLGCAYLTSTNAPAPYIGFFATYGPGPDFIQIVDSAGMTNDSVCVLVGSSERPPGVYYGYVTYEVEGVPVPVVLTVELTLTEGPTDPDSAWVIYDSMYFEADEGTAIVDTGHFGLYSTNAPAAYSAFVLDQPAFTSLLKDSGITNDTIGFQVDADMLPPGLYRDTVVFSVEGADNSPLVSIVYLNVKDTTSPPDSAWLIPNTLNFSAAFGSEILLSDCAVLLSTVDPAPFTAEVVADTEAVFTELVYDTGMTPDSVCVIVDPSRLDPGIHYNWVRCSVEGVDDVYLTIELAIDTMAVDTAALYPSSLSFVAQAYTEELQLGCAYLISSNAPAPYIGFFATFGPGPDFIQIVDSAGMTNDSVCVLVGDSALPPGVYYGYVTYQVEGVLVPVFLTVELTLTEGPTGPDSAWVVPDSMYFEITEGSPTVYMDSFHLSSSNAPALYTASVLNYPSFTTLKTDSGFTDDYVAFQVTADSLPAGLYLDTVLFDVVGTANSPIISVVHLNVIAAAGRAGVEVAQNYPNPFNPATQISFWLPQESDYTLTIFNIAGQVVNRYEGRASAGQTSVEWDASDQASGVYFYRLHAGDETATRKMMLLR
jgi:hypothetical protein